MMGSKDGRAASPNRLSSPTEPLSAQGLGPPGFDPARVSRDEARIWYWLIGRYACLMEKVQAETNGDVAFEIAMEAKSFRHIAECIQRRSQHGWPHIEKRLRDSDRLPKGEDAERSEAAECEASQSGLSDSEGIARKDTP